MEFTGVLTPIPAGEVTPEWGMPRAVDGAIEMPSWALPTGLITPPFGDVTSLCVNTPGVGQTTPTGVGTPGEETVSANGVPPLRVGDVTVEDSLGEVTPDDGIFSCLTSAESRLIASTLSMTMLSSDTSVIENVGMVNRNRCKNSTLKFHTIHSVKIL